tara:strand:+ start:731 stop:1318 length:588 start_codon:yes stop_codon:yes gene_type:complete
MTALSNQMHEKMTVRLNELRGKVITKMTGTGERIKSRPSLPGDNALKEISTHQVMQRNDDGATILGAAIGIPGLDPIVEAAIDVGTDMFADRKAVHERPQDKMTLTPKQQRQIREKNDEDLKVFQALDENLNFLNTAMSCGNIWAMIDPQTNDIQVIEGMDTPKHVMTANNEPSEEHINHIAVMSANKAVGIHLR